MFNGCNWEIRLTLKHHELRVACSHAVITTQTSKHTTLTEFQVFYLLEHSMNQQHARLLPVSNTTFITTTQRKTKTTKQRPFFKHRKRMIAERYAAVDLRQASATNIVTEWRKVCVTWFGAGMGFWTVDLILSSCTNLEYLACPVKIETI